MSEFFQNGPLLGNQYEEDRLLRTFLRSRLPAEMLEEIEPDLRRLGGRAVTDILALGNAAESSPPRHIPFDPWGRRIDRIEVCAAWKQLERIAAEEGIVATAYERRHGPWSRIHQFALLYLYGPSSAIATCPLAMTDGAARVIELHGDDWLRNNPYPRLITRAPEQFWTSGQWMTERAGGSDVSGTSTSARLEHGQYRLHGTKWFTSATTAPMAMTLARIEGAPEGSRGLSLFYLELRDSAGNLQNIIIHRLKDKLGTRALPTAELTLDGTPARLVGGEGQGVRRIAALLNITRAYNACCAVGFMRRGIALVRDYAPKRHVFGKPLHRQPLHVETLADMQVELEAAFHLTFRAAELMGKEECGIATADESAVLRLLTPVVKLYTAKQAIAVTSEVLEAFGGAGYIEDTGLPRLLRDAQVLSIWEGTTNVLSLDALRAIDREGALDPFLMDLRATLAKVLHPELRSAVHLVRNAVIQIENYLQKALSEGTDFLQAGARTFAFSLARAYAAGLLLEFADRQCHEKKHAGAVELARRWCAQNLVPLIVPDEPHRRMSAGIALEED
jgi:alkylation response protein AidB-like acyl-CoA dehydrogenase